MSGNVGTCYEHTQNRPSRKKGAESVDECHHDLFHFKSVPESTRVSSCVVQAHIMELPHDILLKIVGILSTTVIARFLLVSKRAKYVGDEGLEHRFEVDKKRAISKAGEYSDGNVKNMFKLIKALQTDKGAITESLHHNVPKWFLSLNDVEDPNVNLVPQTLQDIRGDLISNKPNVVIACWNYQKIKKAISHLKAIFEHMDRSWKLKYQYLFACLPSFMKQLEANPSTDDGQTVYLLPNGVQGDAIFVRKTSSTSNVRDPNPVTLSFIVRDKKSVELVKWLLILMGEAKRKAAAEACFEDLREQFQNQAPHQKPNVEIYLCFRRIVPYNRWWLKSPWNLGN